MGSVIYQLNARDEIISVGGDWVRFAEANEAADLSDGVIGRPLWDFVTGSTTRYVYRELLARVRAGRTVAFNYRCDSTSLCRFMRMTMVPAVEGCVGFDSETLRTEPRVPPLHRFMSGTATRPGLRMCSWCNRVEVSRSWEDLEIAVERLGLLALAHPPLISHAMCPPCYAQIMDGLDAA